MNPIYSGAHRQMVSAARGQPANWAQGPMGSIPDPMQPSLSAQRSFNNGPDPMQPALAAQQAFTTGPEQQAKFGSQIGSIVPGLGPSITLPGQQQGNPFMQWGNPGKFEQGPQMPNTRPAFSQPGQSNVAPFGGYQPQFTGIDPSRRGDLDRYIASQMPFMTMQQARQQGYNPDPRFAGTHGTPGGMYNIGGRINPASYMG